MRVRSSTAPARSTTPSPGHDADIRWGGGARRHQPEKPLWPIVIGGWALASVMLCLSMASAIMEMKFPDPDDTMRLLEVRDWLSGQSWWDVGQHRLNGGDFAMHWSRLIDLPLAGVMRLLDPFFATDVTNRIAMTIVPLATLLALMALVAAITRRLAGTERAQLAVLLAPLSIPIVYQIRPMRIDHHGWQIVLALTAVLSLIGRPTARSGAICGLAIATLLTVSMEGMPIAAIVMAVAAIAWAIEPRRRAFLIALGWTNFLTAALFQAATRGPAMFAPACDAMAPAWLGILGVAATALTAATLVGARPPPLRLAALAIGGAACLAVLVTTAPRCMQGPFATLDPLTYDLWYRKVSEGLPVWEQIPAWGLIWIALPIVGLMGTMLALRRSAGMDRTNWTILLAVLSGAFAVSVLVLRAGGTANALALPGAAWALLALLERARRIRPVVPRTLATAAALIVVSPSIVAGAIFAVVRLHTPPSSTVALAPGRTPCTDASDVRAAAILPPGVIFAPLDVTPDMIAMTPGHQGVAAGYHRNAAAMHRVIATYIGSPDAAEAQIRASGARYVIGCPALNEMEIYKQTAPDGFWARLERGERFSWLTPVPLRGSPLLVWEVRTPLSSIHPRR